jgi:hypothetical protein
MKREHNLLPRVKWCLPLAGKRKTVCGHFAILR